MRVWERCPLPWQLGGRMGTGEGWGGGIHACCTAGSATVCVCVCDSVFLCVFVLYVMMCKAIVKGRGEGGLKPPPKKKFWTSIL